MQLQKDEIEIVYRKSDGEAVSADFAERLREPAASESRTIEALKKAGATEDDIAAAAGGLRLLESLGGLVSFGETPREPIAKSHDTKGMRMGSWTAEETNRAIEHYSATAQVEKARKPKPAAESVRELEKLEKSVERKHDARAWETIERRAEAIRKSDYKITKARAIAQALDDDPSLYASYVRHQERQGGYLKDHPSEIHKTADAQDLLRRAAQRYRDADPKITEAQAIAKALNADPSLYVEASR